MKILILGAGKMVDALLSGLETQNDEYFIFSPSGVSAKSISKKHNITAVDDHLISNPDLILLGNKPSQLADVARHLKGRFKSTPFVSMLAAVDEQTQVQMLNVDCLIRIMPNLSVRDGKGITLLSSSKADEIQISAIKNWLSPTGLCVEVNESQLDELTLLTGCGPAIYYQFSIFLSECFKSLPKDDVLKLTANLLIGSADLIKNYSGDFESAINDVASKGGVTEAILNSMSDGQFKQQIEKGIESGKRGLWK